MSEVLRQTLLEQGLWFRAEAEQEWDPFLVHPHYRFDKDNISSGFCGISSAEQARRLRMMSTVGALITQELEKNGEDESSRAMRKLFETHQFLGILDETQGLIGAKALFAYGLVESWNGDILSHDHCWVVIEQPNESYDLDGTADQFNIEGGLHIPPVLVQRSKEFDSQQIRHIPKELEDIDSLRTSPLIERLAGMTMDMPGWRNANKWEGYVSWNYYKQVPTVVDRYEELKKQMSESSF